MTTETIHLVGIGGAGMSAIATVLLERGFTVQGSDAVESETTTLLREKGAKVFIGHDASNIEGATTVGVSTAITNQNPELLAALEQDKEVVGRLRLLRTATADDRVIAVSGTHGKTSTSAMAATLLAECSFEPSFIVGSKIANLGAAAKAGSSEWFVLEADESDGSFLGPAAEIAIVTNIEPDHLDFYGSFEGLVDAFTKFLDRANSRIVCGENETARMLGEKVSATLYGFSSEFDVWADNVEVTPFQISYVAHVGDRSCSVTMPITGLHNVLNSLAVIALSYELEIDLDDAAKALSKFTGTSRRFESRGFVNGIDFIDDYAHLPAEIETVLAAAKTGDWNRIVAVFQPHRYSRTAELADEFGPSFNDADLVFIADVYAAGEKPIAGVSGRNVFDAVSNHSDADVVYIPDATELIKAVAEELEDGDLCITLGAGDVTTYTDRIIETLKANDG